MMQKMRPQVQVATCTHRIGVFSSHTRPLDDQLFVAQLHPIEPGYSLMKSKQTCSQTAQLKIPPKHFVTVT